MQQALAAAARVRQVLLRRQHRNELPQSLSTDSVQGLVEEMLQSHTRTKWDPEWERAKSHLRGGCAARDRGRTCIWTHVWPFPTAWSSLAYIIFSVLSGDENHSRSLVQYTYTYCLQPSSPSMARCSTVSSLHHTAGGSGVVELIPTVLPETATPFLPGWQGEANCCINMMHFPAGGRRLTGWTGLLLMLYSPFTSGTTCNK